MLNANWKMIKSVGTNFNHLFQNNLICGNDARIYDGPLQSVLSAVRGIIDKTALCNYVVLPLILLPFAFVF